MHSLLCIGVHCTRPCIIRGTLCLFSMQAICSYMAWRTEAYKSDTKTFQFRFACDWKWDGTNREANVYGFCREPTTTTLKTFLNITKWKLINIPNKPFEMSCLTRWYSYGRPVHRSTLRHTNSIRIRLTKLSCVHTIYTTSFPSGSNNRHDVQVVLKCCTTRVCLSVCLGANFA